jgi:hypothetical protein
MLALTAFRIACRSEPCQYARLRCLQPVSKFYPRMLLGQGARTDLMHPDFETPCRRLKHLCEIGPFSSRPLLHKSLLSAARVG